MTERRRNVKQFKAESKRLLDLMINSIYTNKEIFLRELLSNASDAIDKLYYQSLTDKSIKVNKKDLCIKIEIDKENRLLKIIDTGIGMNKEELENNLGMIAKSGSLQFKEENEKKKDVNIIGQFGVGFYSSFMVSDDVTVISKKYNEEDAYKWESTGAEGYTITKDEKDTYGTTIILKIKSDNEEYNYSDFLDTYTIETLVKKYSDYIRYPIKMNVTRRELKKGSKDEYEDVTKEETLNSMIPLWKKDKNKITEEEYNNFYQSKFYDYENPIKVIHTSVEGMTSYKAILFLPAHAPFDYYSKEYEKGLALYSNGVLIMDKCSDLLPDYFGFVKGVVDSDDLSLNISREILQQDRQLKLIASNIEKKIKSELESMLKDERDKYEKFFKEFGMQLKLGVYNDYGMHKDELKDLLLFYSSKDEKYITLKEYVSSMKDDEENIYYACGETIDKINMLPQVEKVKDKGYNILYLTEYVDEFAIKSLMEYDGKKFVNVSEENLDLDTEEEKKEIKKINDENKEMLNSMKEIIGSDISDVRFTHRLKNHPVCLVSEGPVSIEMQKVLNAMPTDQSINAKIILEINSSHKIADKLKELYKSDKEKFNEYTKILYSQSRLIEGLSIENPTEISNLICDLLSK
ncbi:MAG TPA: molecular chaperone HtpG [Firmicutes bacterium]|jgi:molecular chaperone HtpG|nr:molecular chaperone HtpG [Bacillota bacterium]